MKYTVTLLNTATNTTSDHVVSPSDDEAAETAALDFALSRAAADSVTYLVVGISRGDN